MRSGLACHSTGAVDDGCRKVWCWRTWTAVNPVAASVQRHWNRVVEIHAVGDVPIDLRQRSSTLDRYS